MSPKFKTDTCRFAQLVILEILVANNEKLVETHRDDFTFPFCTFTKGQLISKAEMKVFI